MSLSERDTLVLIIVGSIVGFFVFTLIICLSCCCWIRYWRRRSQRLNSQSEHDSPVLPSSRNHYQRSQKLPSTKLDSNYVKKTKRRRRRFNTNESAITLSFDPPHLINQNVKNLDRFFPTDPTMTTRSWHYEQTQPSSHTNSHSTPSNEPVYASSSTILTSVSTLPVPSQPIPNIPNRFLHELDQVLRTKQDEQQRRPLRYSQSCRQTTEPLPFHYYRSGSPSLVIADPQIHRLEINASNSKFSNSTLLRKARLGQLRDDTAILY